MSRSAVRSGLSAADFLLWERQQQTRHEFFDGEIFAMAGGSPRHAALAARVARALAAAVGSNCEVFSSDLQLGFEDRARYVYADVSVVCGPLKLKPGTTDVVINPTLVVEILSPSTEQYDRGLKWESYRGMASLTDYLLVSQDSPTIEHYRRESVGSWNYSVVGPGIAGQAQVVLLSNGAELALAPLFDGVFGLANG